MDEIESDLNADEVVHIEQLLNEHQGIITRNLYQVVCTNLADMKLDL